MRALVMASGIAVFGCMSFGQGAEKTASFDVASVKASSRTLGPDYNNRLTISAAGISGRNVTLRRLVAEAYDVQVTQVIGPRWLDQNEYDIEARTSGSLIREHLSLMTRGLLAERFGLKQHGESRRMRVYELAVDAGGPKIQPAKEGEAASEGGGLRFHGGMRQLADVIAVQLSIPEATDPNRPAVAGPPTTVLDKTGLAGIYDFGVSIQVEPGTDALAVWRRVLHDQLGLRLESRRGEVPVVVVDNAARIPTEN